MNAQEALNIRDRVVGRFCSEYDREIENGDFPYPEMVLGQYNAVNYRHALPEAQVVIWKPSIWKAATHKSEALAGIEADYIWRSAGPQLWLFEEVPDQLKFFHEGGFEFLGLFLNPLNALYASDIWGGMNYPDGMYFSPTHTVEMCEPLTERCAFIAAAMLFLDQEFVGRERLSHHPRTQRAAELKRRSPLPEINVVTLRRTARDDRPSGSQEGREWSCSWLVSGHWRKQWYPSKAVWKPKYIAPYVKGDLDMPLRQPRGTIYAVTR